MLTQATTDNDRHVIPIRHRVVAALSMLSGDSVITGDAFVNGAV